MIEAGVLRQPLLYLSLFFKQHRSRSDELLQDALQATGSRSLDELVEQGLRSLVRFSRRRGEQGILWLPAPGWGCGGDATQGGRHGEQPLRGPGR